VYPCCLVTRPSNPTRLPVATIYRAPAAWTVAKPLLLLFEGLLQQRRVIPGGLGKKIGSMRSSLESIANIPTNPTLFCFPARAQPIVCIVCIDTSIAAAEGCEFLPPVLANITLRECIDSAHPRFHRATNGHCRQMPSPLISPLHPSPLGPPSPPPS